jgi:hypothetical protein
VRPSSCATFGISTLLITPLNEMTKRMEDHLIALGKKCLKSPAERMESLRIK